MSHAKQGNRWRSAACIRSNLDDRQEMTTDMALGPSPGPGILQRDGETCWGSQLLDTELGGLWQFSARFSAKYHKYHLVYVGWLSAIFVPMFINFPSLTCRCDEENSDQKEAADITYYSRYDTTCTRAHHPTRSNLNRISFRCLALFLTISLFSNWWLKPAFIANLTNIFCQLAWLKTNQLLFCCMIHHVLRPDTGTAIISPNL